MSTCSCVVLCYVVPAVGAKVNGDIRIYDVKRDDWKSPIESSEGIAGAHSDPVW